MWNILILCRIISLWALLSELVMVWLFGLVNCFILVVSSLCVMTCFTFLSVSRLFWLSYSSISRPSFVDLSPFPLFQSVFVSFVMKACLFFFLASLPLCVLCFQTVTVIWFDFFYFGVMNRNRPTVTVLQDTKETQLQFSNMSFYYKIMGYFAAWSWTKYSPKLDKHTNLPQRASLPEALLFLIIIQPKEISMNWGCFGLKSTPLVPLGGKQEMNLTFSFTMLSQHTQSLSSSGVLC